ncbi:MAG: SdiA-regulated domain-containing protein [Porticoccaceae bacterium]
MIHLPRQDNGELLQNGWLSKSDFSGLVLDMGHSGNKGYEGLDYDLKGDRLFITKERDPMQIIEVSDFQKNLNMGLFPEIHNHSELVDTNLFSRDLSSIVLDQETGHLILLSDESQLLIEMTDKGEVVSFRSLSMGFAGLKNSIRQAEGVTLDEEGNLYIVSEPNLFYRFERP